MPHRLRRLRATLPAAFVVAALLVTLLPAVREATRGPVHVAAREVAVEIAAGQSVSIPIAATHVAFHWQGARRARVTVAFGTGASAFGDEIEVEPADASESDGGVTYSDVLWTGGASTARITSDQSLGAVTVVAIDAGVTPDGAVAEAATLQPTVIRRAAWGADESYRFDAAGQERWPAEFAPLQALIVHHTAGRNADPDPAATVRAIYYFDAVTRAWGDMGYNFLIDEAGRIYEGRRARTYAPGENPTGEDLAGDVVRGAQAKGYNDGTVGIAMLGLFDTQLPTTAARDALERLLAWKTERHAIDPTATIHYVNAVSGLEDDIAAISGHRDVNATDCPGGLFYPTFPTLRAHVATRIAATSGANDSTVPTVLSLTAMATDPTGSHTIRFGLIFSEPITDLVSGDFEVGGTSTGWSVASISGKGATYAVTVAAATPTDGSVTLTLDPAAVTDLGGNAGPAAPTTGTANYALDTTAPTVSISAWSWGTSTTPAGYDVHVTFSEPVSGFGATAVVLGGTSNAATPWTVEQTFGSGTGYTFAVDRESPAPGTLTITIPDGGVPDLAGNPNVGSNTVTLIIGDKTAPTTTAPIAWLRSGLVLTTSLAGKITWSGSDGAGSGVATYDVARSIDGGSFAIILTGLTSPTANVGLTPGHKYRFEVRARDKAGNVGAWAAGATTTPSVVQQTPSTIVTYNVAWTPLYSSSYSGGSVRYTSVAGRRVTITTTARSLAFVTTRGPTRGAIKVYVDGVYAATIDLYAATTQYRYVAYSRTWTSVGTHSLRIVVVGTAGRPRVDADAFLVLR